MSISIDSIAGNGFEGMGLIASEATTRQGEAFDQLLKRATEGAGEDEIRKSAQQLVSATFITPMLASVRESSMAAEPFKPTPAEKQFGALLDQQIADEIVKSSNLPIVDRLAQSFGTHEQSRTGGLEVTG